jgi:uncharacterized protein
MAFDFDDAHGHFAALLDELSLSHSASYLHGSLAGLLISGAQFSGASWLDLALSEDGLSADLPDEAAEELAELAQNTRRQLYQSDVGISPLMPDDEDALVLRVQALHDWCGGFLGGLGLSGKLKKNSVLSKDLKEALRDLERIAAADIALDADDPESDENALMELFEFARVSAALAFQELGVRKPTVKAASDRTH